jgi:putative aminopeptidase FrvX
MADADLEARLADLTLELMRIPGLSGHEGRVRRAVAAHLRAIVPDADLRVDTLGNLSVELPSTVGDAPAVLVFAHLDQLGLIVRKVEPGGFLRVERLGGVPERALASQAVVFQLRDGRTLPGVIANKSHHATAPEEKYRVIPYQELYVDAGFESAEAVRAAGIDVGTPVVYAPDAVRLGEHRIAGTSVDDRAACAVLVEVLRALARPGVRRPRTVIGFSVQEEFNLRGALPMIRRADPALVLQLDLVLATDTPDMAARGDVRLGAGPAMSLYSFHGRGTLNGLIPHPRLVAHVEETAAAAGLPLQRSAHVGALTETSYAQLEGPGLACIDLGFPCRYTHSSREVCDVRDLAALTRLVTAAVEGVGPGFDLSRDGWEG